MNIPIEDHKWTPVPDNAGFLPAGHRAEAWHDPENGEYVVRIVGPNAHVYGKDELLLSEAVTRALKWFREAGSEL